MFLLKEESWPEQLREVLGAVESPSACILASEQGGCTFGFLPLSEPTKFPPMFCGSSVLWKWCFVGDSGQLFHALKYHNPPNTKRGFSALLLHLVGLRARRLSVELRTFKTIFIDAHRFLTRRRAASPQPHKMSAGPNGCHLPRGRRRRRWGGAPRPAPLRDRPLTGLRSAPAPAPPRGAGSSADTAGWGGTEPPGTGEGGREGRGGAGHLLQRPAGSPRICPGARLRYIPHRF